MAYSQCFTEKIVLRVNPNPRVQNQTPPSSSINLLHWQYFPSEGNGNSPLPVFCAMDLRVIFHSALPCTSHFYPVRKSYELVFQNISRIWPLVTTSTATFLFQTTISFPPRLLDFFPPHCFTLPTAPPKPPSIINSTTRIMLLKCMIRSYNASAQNQQLSFHSR